MRMRRLIQLVTVGKLICSFHPHSVQRRRKKHCSSLLLASPQKIAISREELEHCLYGSTDRAYQQ